MHPFLAQSHAGLKQRKKRYRPHRFRKRNMLQGHYDSMLDFTRQPCSRQTRRAKNSLERKERCVLQGDIGFKHRHKEASPMPVCKEGLDHRSRIAGPRRIQLIMSAASGVLVIHDSLQSLALARTSGHNEGATLLACSRFLPPQFKSR
jgi:hypothetical protein